MTPRETLIAARAKIEAPERWTQGEFARTAKGNKAKPLSRRAQCWCSIGAVAAVTKRHPVLIPNDVYQFLQSAMGITERLVSIWNDDHTHAEVMAAFGRAIELAGDA